MSKDSSNTDASFTLENLKQAIERFKEYKPSLDDYSMGLLDDVDILTWRRR